MPKFVLRGSHRAVDGRIGLPLFEETILATDPKEAVRLANERDSSSDDATVNALWLVDADGVLHWSLRRADEV